MNKTVARLLGERSMPPVDAQTTPEQPEETPGENEYANPTIDQLLAVWQGGNHEAVALRVLDALDDYQDFLILAFKLGHAGAMELGKLMDELTAEGTSPHRYDRVTDRDIANKFGNNTRISLDKAPGSAE